MAAQIIFIFFDIILLGPYHYIYFYLDASFY